MIIYMDTLSYCAGTVTRIKSRVSTGNALFLPAKKGTIGSAALLTLPLSIIEY